MQFLRLFSVCSALTLAACSSSLSVSSLNPSPPIYEQGDPVLVSKKRHEVLVRLVSRRFSSETSDLPSFLVVLTNNGKAPIDFSISNVTAESGGKPARVITFEKLQKKIRTQAALLAMSAAMNGASQSIAASMPQQTFHTGSAYAYGSSGGYTRGSYTGVSTTFNPAVSSMAVSQINANTATQIRGIAASRNAALQDTETMLQRDTVFPGRAAGGVVKLNSSDLQRGKPLRLVVSIDGELHEFYFDVGK